MALEEYETRGRAIDARPTQMRAGLSARHEYADSNASMAPQPRQGLGMLLEIAADNTREAFRIAESLASTNDRVHGMHVPMPPSDGEKSQTATDSSPLYVQLEVELRRMRSALASLSQQADRAALL